MITTKSHSNKGNNTKLYKYKHAWKFKEETVHFNIKWNTVKILCGFDSNVTK